MGQMVKLSVDGMDCSACAAKVEIALKRMDCVADATVNLSMETVDVVFADAAGPSLAEIEKKLKSFGYGARVVTPIAAPVAAPAPEVVKLSVDGMDCSACAAKVETALKRMDCVADASVNLGMETVDVTLAAAAGPALEEIAAKLKALGYGATPVTRVTPVASQVATAPIEISDTPTPAAKPRETVTAQSWWQTRKGRLVIALGALLGAAYAISFLATGYAEWVFIAAVAIGLVPFARQAIVLARNGSPFSIEMLMSVAAVGALAIGAAEEAAAVIFLFAVGELLESISAGRARAGIKALLALAPKTALRLGTDGRVQEVDIAALNIGDAVLVRPGDRVTADGTIIAGESNLDDSPVTGESVPHLRKVGDGVFAGSINIDSALRIRVEKHASDNTIARIIHMVEVAQASKSPTARFIETFSAYYTPLVMAIAALVIVVPPLAFGGDWYTWVYRGLALLLIACPCALVLSTPAAVASGLAVATRRGLLIKGGKALELLGRTKVVAFDKTGTLTKGQPQVTDIIPVAGETRDGVLTLAAAVEAHSSHPLARAIAALASTSGLRMPTSADEVAVPGSGVSARIDGRRIAVGSLRHARELTGAVLPLDEQALTLERAGKTVVAVIDESGKRLLGILALRDEPREDAREGVESLKRVGIDAMMLTGDNSQTAKAIAEQLGIEWKAELLPEDKLQAIRDLKRRGNVAMIGDGINDAPALATADVGIAMGGGTDVAIESADASVLQDRITDVAYLIALSRATMANIRQNVTIALGLKAVFLVTTVLGISGLWMAVIADTGATAIVTLNALRLLNFRKR